MSFVITPTGKPCGAEVCGLDLTCELSAKTVVALRQAWLEHHVLFFPDQPMSDDDLERFTLYFGDFGCDPFIAPIEGREHIAAICHQADEKASIFAEGWHSDWSFQAIPPAGTCLLSITIPPLGGDTGFVNQHQALAAMPTDLRARIEAKIALHSAAAAYAPDGMYGKADKAAGRSMAIIADDSANEIHRHSLICQHPETGVEGLFSCMGYICGIEGMDDEPSHELLEELYRWQTQEQFEYRHQWSEDMLIMWDNRSVLHRVYGGFEGHDRLLHRTTIAGISATA